MKYFAGLDVSIQETAICIVDEDGIVIREGKAASEPDDLARWLAADGVTLARVGLEAGPCRPGCIRSYELQGSRRSASRPDG
jgi:transposase